MNRFSKIVAPVILLTLWSTTLFSVFGLDISQMNFRVLDIKDGLSQNTVSSIFQDSKGFIWFCTDEGVNRYDGYGFLKFDRQPENKNSLISNFATCITESSPGVFWIGTKKGFSVFQYDANKYINLENPGQISKITVEDSVTVWMQTQYSLYKVRLVSENNGKGIYTVNIEPMNAYREILCKTDKYHFLVLGRNNHLYSYDTRTKLMLDKKNIEIWDKLISRKINSVVIDKYSNYWVGTDYGLYKMDSNYSTIDSFSAQRKKYLGLNDKITALTIGKAGNVYIATNLHGLIIYDIRKNRFIEYRSDPYNLNSLPDNKLISLLIDNSGSIWVGTKGSGVATSSQFKYKFKHITQEPFKTTWLTNKYILSFEADNNENIWIGTDGSGLYKFNTKDNVFSNWRNNASSGSLSNDVVQELLIDSYGSLWVGTLNGICKFNSGTNTFKRYFFAAEKTGTQTYSTIRLFETAAKELYALDDHSIYQFNRTQNKFEEVSFGYNNINIIPRSIIEDADSTWWMATSDGLVHLNIRSGLLDSKALDILNKKFFIADQLNCLLPNSENEFWIGSGNNGLFLFNKKTLQIVKNYTEKNGLCNDHIYGILKDNSGKLWMSTNSGISVFDPVLKLFRNYDVNDGLQSNEFNDEPTIKRKVMNCCLVVSMDLISSIPIKFRLIISNPLLISPV